MQDIPVSGRIHIAVMLTDTPENLESVVAVGYGSQYKEQITSAITQVKVEFSIYVFTQRVIKKLGTLSADCCILRDFTDSMKFKFNNCNGSFELAFQNALAGFFVVCHICILISGSVLAIPHFPMWNECEDGLFF